MKVLPLKEQVYDLRAEVKRTGEKLLALREDDEFSPLAMAMGSFSADTECVESKDPSGRLQEAGSPPAAPDYSEMNANLMLAYRALEDAGMRLGKLVQALDGGTSLYPR